MPTYRFVRRSVKDEKYQNIAIPSGINGCLHRRSPFNVNSPRRPSLWTFDRGHEWSEVVFVDIEPLSDQDGDKSESSRKEGGKKEELEPINNSLIDKSSSQRHGWK